MTREEFERKIEAQGETTTLDYKANMGWDVKSFAKDIIAMSNHRDPGYIIIGVKEVGNTFTREGVSDDNLKSYKIDVMKDQLMSCADPAVDIQVFVFNDSEKKNYVVIKVAPFKEVPIISRKEYPGELKANTLYYRNTNKRVESAPISNSNDFRDLIEIAAMKLMQKRKSQGYIVNSSNQDLFKEELKDVPLNGVLQKIKTRGYWEITFQPNYPEQIRSAQDCLDLVRKSTVQLGGWELPYIPPGDTVIGGGYPGQNFYEIWTDWGARKEFFRMYKSGQVLICRALVEDWYREDENRASLAELIPSGTVLNVFYSVTYFITEVFQFLLRLAENGIYKDGVILEMKLHNTKDRKLRLDHTRRTTLMRERKTQSSEIVINKTLDFETIITDSMSVAAEVIIEILDSFGYNQEKLTVTYDQNQYIAGTN